MWKFSVVFVSNQTVAMLKRQGQSDGWGLGVQVPPALAKVYAYDP